MQPHRTREKADYTGLLAVVMAAPIYFVSLYFVDSEVAKYIGMCAAVHIVAIKLNWALRRNFWFWGAIAVLFGLHIPVIMRIPLPTHWIPAYSLIPIALADFGIVQGIIVLLEKLTKKWQPA
jgi:hypothetical protein